MHLLTLLSGTLHSLFIDKAHASVGSAIDTVGGLLPSLFGLTAFDTTNDPISKILVYIVGRFNLLLASAAILMIMIAGFRMIVAQDDDAISKAKNTILACLVGLVMSQLIKPFVLSFYGYRGEVPQGNINAGSDIFSAEIRGIIDWSLGLVAILAIIVIAFTAIRAIASATNEEGVTKMRRTIFAIGAGILLISVRQVLSITIGAGNFGSGVGDSDALAVIIKTANIINAVLGLVALAAVTVIVFAGIKLIISGGDEETVTKSKQVIYRALLGLATILVSFALLNFVFLAFM